MGTTIKSEFLEKLEGLTEPETVLRTVKGVDSIVLMEWLLSKCYRSQLQLLSKHIMIWPHYSGNMFCVLVRAFQLDKYLTNSLKSQTRKKHGEDMSRHTSVHIQG